METADQISKFEEFFEETYNRNIIKAVGEGRESLIVSFNDLINFDPDLADEFLDNPEKTIEIAESVIEKNDDTAGKRLNVRFSNLPENQKLMISELRQKHLGKMLELSGLIRRKSDVRPQVTKSTFECPNCGNIIHILQTEDSFKEPSVCGCGRKGKFKPLKNEFVDAQSIVLEENPEELEGGAQPKRINILLKDDLTNPLTEQRANPGSRLTVTGYLKEVPVYKSGKRSIRFELLFEANYAESMQEDFYQIEISEGEKSEILKLAEDPEVFEKLAQSIVPSTYGYEKIKEALLLQMLGGVHKKRKDGTMARGDCHILLVGDPGAGKSQILKRISNIAPKGRYVAGRGASGAGLTAAVVKDEFLGGWSLEAGALVLSNNGLVAIDEMDKMSTEDRSAMHEALEQQSISISKANIQATLSSKTTVLAASNPKLGRFDRYGVLAEQIDMPPTLISRFDLIFPIIDQPESQKDRQLASHILKLHQDPSMEGGVIDTEILKKYVAYARQNCEPEITDSARDKIMNFYIEKRNAPVSDERKSKPISISPRQLEALVRLSEASAKSRLSEKVEDRDAEKAIELVMYYLEQFGTDKEGNLDIDRITTGITTSKRDRIRMVIETISEMQKATSDGLVDTQQIQEHLKEKGMPETETEEIIGRLKREGEIYEPKPGFYSKLK